MIGAVPLLATTPACCRENPASLQRLHETRSKTGPATFGADIVPCYPANWQLHGKHAERLRNASHAPGQPPRSESPYLAVKIARAPGPSTGPWHPNLMPVGDWH
ncbi:hypothetical protein FQR65_LT20548 [Abscondita terminalis]|nr:hypothetical protein FQR65_LT20548 [Abscondita terminalis]